MYSEGTYVTALYIQLFLSNLYKTPSLFSDSMNFGKYIPDPSKHLTRDNALYIWKQTRRLIVLVIGLTVVAIGFALIVLPGPAIIVIPLGLIILATEFVWAKRLLKKVRNQLGIIKKKIIK